MFLRWSCYNVHLPLAIVVYVPPSSSYIDSFTSSLTFCSMALSSRPRTCQPVYLSSPRKRGHLTLQRYRLLLAELCAHVSPQSAYLARASPQRANCPPKRTAPWALHHVSLQGYAPYLAKSLGSVPLASRMRMGVYGLCFFMVGYDFVRKLLGAVSHPLDHPHSRPASLSLAIAVPASQRDKPASGRRAHTS